MDERDVKAHNEAIQNEVSGTYCRVCLRLVCTCNKFMDTKVHTKVSNDSMQELQDEIAGKLKEANFYIANSRKYLSIEDQKSVALKLLGERFKMPTDEELEKEFWWLVHHKKKAIMKKFRSILNRLNVNGDILNSSKKETE